MDDSKTANEAISADPDRDYGPSKTGLMDYFKGQKMDPNELGKEYFQKSLQYDEYQLQRDSVKVRRKLDFMVLPMVCCLCRLFPCPSSV